MKIKKMIEVVKPFVLLLCIYLLATCDYIVDRLPSDIVPIYKWSVAIYAILAVSVKDIVRKLQ